MIQRRDLTEEDFRGERFRDHNHPQKGNNDLLILTRPDIVADLHDVYYAAGADISETNTFSSTTIAQADYGLEDAVYDLNYEGARIAREVADRWTEKEPHKPRFVAGAIGPTNRTLSLSPDVNDPGYRAVTYDEVYEAYKQQARALHHGGVDLGLSLGACRELVLEHGGLYVRHLHARRLSRAELHRDIAQNNAGHFHADVVRERHPHVAGSVATVLHADIQRTGRGPDCERIILDPH
ncbi:hypothetical protein LTR94_028967, partial [Friedmanniomyces endolithicus]